MLTFLIFSKLKMISWSFMLWWSKYNKVWEFLRIVKDVNWKVSRNYFVIVSSPLLFIELLSSKPNPLLHWKKIKQIRKNFAKLLLAFRLNSISLSSCWLERSIECAWLICISCAQLARGVEENLFEMRVQMSGQLERIQ